MLSCVKNEHDALKTKLDDVKDDKIYKMDQIKGSTSTLKNESF